MVSDIESSKFVELLLEWHEHNRRIFPWRQYRTPYNLLVAEFFLQRTPANRVAGFYCQFIQKYPDPFALCSADPNVITSLSTQLGLKKRILWLIEASKIVCERFNGRIPDSHSDLRSLPGVGCYTASAILSFGYGKDVAILDVNVARVLTRFFGCSNSPRAGNRRLQSLAEKLLPTGRGLDFNEAVLDFAALVCRKKPQHEHCPLIDFCAFYSHSRRLN